MSFFTAELEIGLCEWSELEKLKKEKRWHNKRHL